MRKRLILCQWKSIERKKEEEEEEIFFHGRTREFANWLKAAKFGSITAIMFL